MRVRPVAMGLMLTLTAATAAMAQSDVPGPGMEDGIVAQIDTTAHVVRLEDGRMFREQAGTEFVSKGYPTSLGSLRPGSYVTISGAQPVAYRDGQYVNVED
jgi:hypothetical protein